MSNSLATRARQIIEHIAYATIATVTPDGQPWNSPVAAVFDEQLNFYWVSWLGNQHSINIRHSGRAFIVIYDSQAPEGTGEGVYIQAEAHEVTDPTEITKAIQLGHQRHGGQIDPPEEYLNSSPRRFFKAVPQKVWMNGEGDIDGYYIDTRVEVEL